MKKFLSLLAAGALMVSLFTACTKTHVHQAVGGWECDAKEHWMLCEDGEKMNAQAHALDDLSVCSVCGAIGHGTLFHAKKSAFCAEKTV